MAIKQSIEPAFDEAKLDNKGESARKCVSNCTAEDAIAAGKAARQAIQSLYKDSQLFSKKPEFTFYDRKDFKMGKRLGEGGFCVVRQVDGVPLMPAEQGEGDGKKQMLAVKHLKHSVMLDPKKFQLGAADLAIEANFLAVLNHENILKLHGVAAGPIEACVASSRSEEDCGYFIIVDRIVYTLQRKIEIWRRDNDELNGDFIARMMPASFNRKRTSLLAQRLETALRISDAMAHIHAKRIVYRDLKPENIGFDAKGNVKLFDFGLAREMKEKYSNGTYKLTGNTGSKRFMAPEVASKQHYGLPVDVFSFGILLYDITSLEDPFKAYLERNGALPGVGETPNVDNPSISWFPLALRELMKKCWTEDPSERPTFESIKSTLDGIIRYDALSDNSSGQKVADEDSQAYLSSMLMAVLDACKGVLVGQSSDVA